MSEQGHPLELTSSSSTADRGTTLTLRDAAQRLGCSLKTARRMVERGQLTEAELVNGPSGPQWMVSVAAVEQVLAQRRAGTVTAGVAVRASAAPARLQGELERLKRENAELKKDAEQVPELKRQLAVEQAVAHERGQMLEQLNESFRLMALTVAAQSTSTGAAGAPNAGTQSARRRWWKRSPKAG